MPKQKTMKPNDLGKTFLVDECQKITMHEYISRVRAQLKETILSAELSVFDTPIDFTTSHTGFGGIRHWLVCPQCTQRKGVLFMHPINQEIGCRVCLGLEYRAQRYKGMVEGS
jgi:hypothetical protein